MSNLDKRKIRESFNRSAKDYDQHAVLQKTVAERLLTRLDLININPAWILDAGSGTGSTARALAKRYRSARIVQADFAPLMLHQSRSRSWRFWSRQHYLCADVEMLPIADRGFDLIFSSLTYQWCNDPGQTFTEAGRILKPNSLLLFATLGPDTLKELRASWAAADDHAHVNTFLDMHDIGDALVRAGMEGVVMDVETITMHYDDCKGLMSAIKAVGAHNVNTTRLRGLTGKGKLQRMVQAYEQCRSKDGLPVTYEIVYGHAWTPVQDHVAHHHGQTVYVPVSNVRRYKDRSQEKRP